MGIEDVISGLVTPFSDKVGKVGSTILAATAVVTPLLIAGMNAVNSSRRDKMGNARAKQFLSGVDFTMTYKGQQEDDE